MENKGNDALLKTSRLTEWTFNNGGYSSVLFAGFVLLGCVLAYIIAVGRGSVDAFLPLISDAAGSPPQNGVFGTLISIGGMFGVMFMILRYMILLEKNQQKSKLVTFLNKLSLFIGIISMCGITLVTGYPLNFYRNKDVWFTDVGIPHIIGGVALFGFGIIYIAIQCILTLFIKPRNNTILLTRVAICIVCTVTFVYHLVTVPDNFNSITIMNNNNTKNGSSDYFEVLPPTLGASLKIPIIKSDSYVSSAITEWLLVFFFCGFFLSFFKETQEYSLLVVVETEFPETAEETKKPGERNGQPAVPSVSNERRTSEVRTALRRDSTCQTADDGNDVIITPNPTSYNQNGKYMKRQVSSFEMLSGNKLEKLIENTMKAKKKDGVSSGNGVNPVTDGIREYIENVMEKEEKAQENGNALHTDKVETVDRGC